jgi:hypothetical protein
MTSRHDLDQCSTTRLFCLSANVGASFLIPAATLGEVAMYQVQRHWRRAKKL